MLMFWSSRGRESLGSGGIRAKEVPRAGQCCLRTGGPKTDFQHANQRGAANQELHQSDYARFTPRQMYTRTAAITRDSKYLEPYLKAFHLVCSKIDVSCFFLLSIAIPVAAPGSVGRPNCRQRSSQMSSLTNSLGISVMGPIDV